MPSARWESLDAAARQHSVMIATTAMANSIAGLAIGTVIHYDNPSPMTTRKRVAGLLRPGAHLTETRLVGGIILPRAGEHAAEGTVSE